jgi:hypothetical protein
MKTTELRIIFPPSFSEEEQKKLWDYINKELIFESVLVGQQKLDGYFRTRNYSAEVEQYLITIREIK